MSNGGCGNCAGKVDAMRIDARGWRLWLRRGLLAITDQGLMSGSNFVLSIVLARWLSAEQYGSYALAFSIFFFLSAAHQALLLEPMSVLGTAQYRDRRREYTGALLWLQGAFSLVLLAVVAAAASVTIAVGNANIGMALFGLAVAAPGILLFWLARMACYVEFSPARAAAGAVLYSVLLLGGAAALSGAHAISPFRVFLVMGGAALVVAVSLLASLRPAVLCSKALLRDALGRHWRYGRWALGSSLVIWAPGNAFYAITSAFLGIGSAGAFRALMNLTFPVTHSSNALSLLFQPQLSRRASDLGAGATVKPVMRIAALYACGALLWLGIVAAATHRIWQLLYGGHYQDASGLAVLALAGAVFQVAAYAPAVGLRALQSPSTVFAAYSIAAGACLLGGIPATRLWGLPGAVASFSGVMLFAFVATLLLYLHKVRGAGAKPEAHPAPEPALAAEAS